MIRPFDIQSFLEHDPTARIILVRVFTERGKFRVAVPDNASPMDVICQTGIYRPRRITVLNGTPLHGKIDTPFRFLGVPGKCTLFYIPICLNA